MAYEVTASRKRPQTFDELTGQEFVASTLKNSMKTGRIAHAYLFSGPRGVGKTSAARILAKALNCQEGPTDVPCGTCTSCQEITRGNSLDVIEIDGASNTSVNDVREIKDEVLFSPNSSRYKVYIIDEVHMLSNSAFNALLKTIEEPPPYIVFVFATTELHKVPATIKSRCQQFNFRLIHPEDIRQLLRGICDELGIQAEDDALFWIAKEATGSLRDAYTLFDQVVSFSEGSISLTVIREKLGLVGLDSLNELAEIFADCRSGDALTYVDEVLSRGVSVEQFIVDLTEYFRNLLFLKNGIRREAVLGYAPDRFSKKAAEAFSSSQLEKAVDLLFQLYRNIRYSLNQRFELELLVSRLSALSSFFSHREMMAQLESLRSRFVTGDISVSDTPGSGNGGMAAVRPASPASAASVVQPAASRSVVEDDTAGEDDSGEVSDENASDAPPDLLKQVTREIRKKKLALSSALEKAVSWEIEGDTLKLVFDSPFSASFVRQDVSEIAEKIRSILGRTIKIETDVMESGDGGKGPEKDDRVEMVRKVFRGQVIKGE